MTQVLNVDTGTFTEYDKPPIQAVLAARRELRGEMADYWVNAPLRKEGDYIVLGQFYALRTAIS